MPLVKQLSIKYIRSKFSLLSSLSKKGAAEKAFQLFISPQSRVKKDLPPVFEKAEKLAMTFEGLKIRGFRWNGRAEKKVLILHGFESSIVNFDRYVSPLVKKGFCVLAFDAPAHGGSQGNKINAIDYKNFIQDIISKFGPITSFITHSFGGLALSLALEEMPHDNKWKVVMIAPATESTTAMDNFFNFLKLDAGVRSEFDKLITAANQQPPSWYSVSRAAANIKARVLFLQDKNDELTPLSDVEPLMKKAYPNFRFIISEGLGHSKIYRHPSTVQAVIDFL